LPALYFTLLGYRKNQPISMHDLRSAQKLATAVHKIQWSGNLHDLSRWAQLLIQHRIMRYKKNRAYPAEIEVVARSAEWLLTNSLRL